MGLHLIAAVSDPTWLGWTFIGLKVLVGLGMVIFVHELGHFLVAKLCGVKCEKFYLGFDFFGLKIWKFRYGETEYGIGVFPLGGYVKMLGQEDNPARLREELERAKAAQQAPEGAEGTGAGAERNASGQAAAAPQRPGEPIDLEAAHAALYDPRSYLAQSVPKRMAIISAGVIMNVIFAFVAAVIGYGLGVEQVACAIGEVVPGRAAWKVDLRTGDHISQIAGKRTDRFEDLMAGVSLGDVSHGIEMVAKRPGVKKPLSVRPMPDETGNRPTIGVWTPYSRRLDDRLPTLPGSAAAKARPSLKPDDLVVQLGDVPVPDYAELRRQLALHFDKPLKITVRREKKQDIDGEEESDAPDEGAAQDAAASDGVTVTVEVPAQPMRRLGLVMEMGPVTAVQDGSPAAAAGIQAGDRLRSIDGRPPGDPMTLDQRLRRRAGQTVRLVLSRGGEEITREVKLRKANWYTKPFVPDSPVEVAPLGIACSVLNRVAGVIEGSPAADSGIAAGDQVVQAVVVAPDEETLKREGLEEAADLLGSRREKVEFGDEQRNWPFLTNWLQSALPGTSVELTLRRGEGEVQSVTLQPAAASDWFDPMRGLNFQKETFVRKADSLGDAVGLGFGETVDALTLIWRSLEKLSSGQVSPKELQGPVGIIRIASYKAAQGTGELLVFLCILSANLAILNFLPIPVLDGGHMVFLAYEGIRGKPPSEGVFLALSYLGLIFILALMIWVIGLDVGRLLPG